MIIHCHGLMLNKAIGANKSGSMLLFIFVEHKRNQKMKTHKLKDWCLLTAQRIFGERD
jgi:hypothetical protein